MGNFQNSNNSSDEIDLIEVIRHIWANRKLVLKVIVVFIVFGLVISLSLKNQYKAEVHLLPEVNGSHGGVSQLLQQFGGIGGFSPMMESADAIRPNLYPEVLKSTPFFMYLMDKSIKKETKEGVIELSIFTYMDKHMSASFLNIVIKYSIKLPWTLLDLFKGEISKDDVEKKLLFDEIPQMNSDQYEVYKSLRKRINASINQRSNIISISSEFPDPQVAAQVAWYAVDYLTNYITQYRIEKAKLDLEFIQERHAEKETEFLHAQLSLARFRDANINIVSAAARSEEQRLEDHYNLTFNVFNSLAQQLEKAQIKVQEETPVIKKLEPGQIPMEKSKPKRSLILIISGFFGGVIGITLIFLKNFWTGISSRLREKGT